MKRLSISAAVILTLLFFTPGAAAQIVNDGTQTGLPATATFFGSAFDTVSYQNGNLHVRIPIRTIPQRNGKSLTWNFQYDMETYLLWEDLTSTPPSYGVDNLGGSPNTIGWRLANNLMWSITSDMSTFTCVDGIQYGVWDQWAVVDPDGTKHPVFLRNAAGPPGCAPQIDKGLTFDGSGIRVDKSQSPTVVILKDGTQVLPTWKDANGNTMSASSDTLQRNTLTVVDVGQQTYTTPLGHTVGGPQYTNWNYTDTNGVAQSYRLDYQAIDILTHFCGSLSNCTEYSATSLVPSTLTLPNNAGVYRFTWQNNTAAQLTRIDLPAGGYISYTYGTYSTGLKKLDQWTKQAFVRTRIASRTVSDGQTTNTWTYDGAGTLIDPLGNKEVHGYISLPGCSPNCFPGTYEGAVQYYNPAGTLLRTVQNDWASEIVSDGHTTFQATGNPRIIRVTTTLDNGLITKRETDYETLSASFLNSNTTYTTSWLNPTAVREYDYGTSAAGPLLRTTNFTYLHSGNSTYQTRNIADRPVTKTILNGSGGQVAKTTYEYDVYTHTNQTMQPSNAVQHDSTYNTSFTYRGDLTATQLWRNTDGALLTTTIQFDDAGNLLSAIDPLLHKTSFDYTDSWTNSACTPAGQGKAYVTTVTNALNQVATASFNSCSGLVGSNRDPNLLTTSFSYDFLGRSTQTNSPDGGRTTNCYTDVGGSTCTQAPAPFSVVTTKKINSATNLNLTTVSVTDGLNRVKQSKVTSDPQGTVYTDTTYDANGRVATVSNPYRTTSDPTYGITTYTYDALNRKTKETYPDGSFIQTAYCGPSTLATDPTGKWRRSRIDGLGRLVEVDEPNAVGATVAATGCPGTGEPIWITSYTFDTLGNMTQVLQNSSRQRNFTYDSLSRLLTAANPESGTITYTYDADGNVLTKKDARNITTTYSLDALHRTLGMTYSNGDPALSYVYDQTNCLGLAQCANIGHRTSMTDAGGSEIWAFDVLDRIHKEQRTTISTPSNITKSTTYTLDLAGNLTSVVYPTGRTVNYTYDSANRPSVAQDSANGIAYALGTCANGIASNGVCYAPPGAVSTMTIGQTSTFTGLNFTDSYNSRLQPVQIRASSTGGNAIDITYSFVDPSTSKNAGHVYSITNNLDGTRSQTFAYDQLNRVTSALTTSTHATSPTHCWGEIYSLDSWGNLLSIAATTNSAYTGCVQESGFTKTADASNHLSGFSYDVSGNTTNDGVNTYTWDGESQLKSGGGVNYLYDGAGRRVSKSNGKLYWYGSGGEILAETNAAGTTLNEYIFFGGKRVALLPSSGNPQFYAEDLLGTSRVITTNTGVVCYDADFYPYGGERTPYTNTCPQNNYKFEGKERDTETGNDDFSARYYSNRFGRWLSADWSAVPVPVPYANLTNPQTLNLYAMVADDPESFADLDGHGSVDVGVDWPVPSADALTGCAVHAESCESSDQQDRNSSKPKNQTAQQQAQPKPKPKPKPKQKLTFNTVSGGSASKTWVVQWKLSEKSKSGGWIVQNVTWTTASGKQTKYWEAWQVPANSEYTKYYPDPQDDLFAGPSGTTISSEAKFYEGLQLPSSFMENNPDTYAHILPSTTVNPNLPTVNATAPVDRWWASP